MTEQSVKSSLFKASSLEQFLLRIAALFTMLILSLMLGLFVAYQASVLVIVTCLMLVLPALALLFLWVKQTAISPYYNLSVALEAIRQEDYSLRANPSFQSGAVKLLNDEVALMAGTLQRRKTQYDQQAVLVLKLIEQLASPIGIFDEQARLQHANDAFSLWCKTPWQSVKHSHASQLGFCLEPDVIGQKNVIWRLAKQQDKAKWQLKFSHFTMQNTRYQLVLLTNIEQVVYHTELAAWSKMTRVLSHEINNSLSPIKSLAQSLLDLLTPDNAEVAQALNVIVARSDGLMTFVNRYASLSQNYDVQLQAVPIEDCLLRIKGLFDYPIVIKSQAALVHADPVLLEQVLVNLVKNAIEACENKQAVTIATQVGKTDCDIVVLDEGVGISSFDNIFVPFYTTKEQGKGIGLSLSRNMIEQQGGKLIIQNRSDRQGVEAKITLTRDYLD
jgi:two-component system nitrogen regulation sensor histidine kinase NtrY